MRQTVFYWLANDEVIAVMAVRRGCRVSLFGRFPRREEKPELSKACKPSALKRW